MFAAGLPFLVPEILEFVAFPFRDSGKISSKFPGILPELSSRTPGKTPETATALSSFCAVPIFCEKIAPSVLKCFHVM